MIATQPVTARSGAKATRLAWLDALRGIGAMAVVAEHALPWLMPSLRPYWFSLGMYGVLVFFLVSGYIIPASLEKRGEVGAFWVSRVFRLYPLYLLVIALVLAMAFWVPVRQEVPRHPSAVAAHVSMLLDVVHTGALADPMWTLSYEMVFYLLVTALFVGGVHRRSGTLAIAFGVVAVAAGHRAIGVQIGVRFGDRSRRVQGAFQTRVRRVFGARVRGAPGHTGHPADERCRPMRGVRHTARHGSTQADGPHGPTRAHMVEADRAGA
ncbi:acyltransferase family protein [Microbispora rosea]